MRLFGSTTIITSMGVALTACVSLTVAACGGGGGGGGGGGAVPSPTAPSPNLAAERALAQTGLGIALASTVLRSQLLIVVRATFSGTQTGVAPCTSLPGGGSVRSGATITTQMVFYDATCSQPFVVAQTHPQTTTLPGGALRVVTSETATYYGLDGTPIGTLDLSETAVVHSSGAERFDLSGLGVFKPVGDASLPVQLGLICAIPASGAARVSFACSDGLAQDFRSIGLAVGSVTALTLSIDTTTVAAPVGFSGTDSTVVTGPLGSLTLTNAAGTSLVVQGGMPYASFATSGSAGQFVLFPPTPTAWTVTDAAHGLQFKIAVVNNTTRSLSMLITQLRSGRSLATATIDKSGTGTITYSDGSTSAITAWTLAD